MKEFVTFFATLAVACAVLAGSAVPGHSEPRHAIAMHGEPKYPADMTHFPYVNPNAPKGGRLTLGQLGSYDSLNPLIVKGSAATGVRNYVYESLLARGLDEPFTLYGLIAEKVDMSDDRNTITFYLNPKAKFSDGDPLNADDVLFSYETLRDKGRPNHRTYYKKISKAERIDDHTLRFVLDGSGDREMPLIIGLMPILPSHLLTAETFARTTLKPVVGSGPFSIDKVDPGRSLTYKRNPDWWGRDLSVNRGRYNFDEIRYDYYREAAVLFEAFKAGQIDARSESNPAYWAERYNIAAVKDGRIIKGEFEIGLPAGMNALVFNTRREIFKDKRVRKALIQIFDFEWINRNLFTELYQRTQSYFARSALASTGVPTDEREKKLFADLDPGKIPSSILDGSYRMPVSPGSGQNRDNWRSALKLLREAGYELKNRQLTHKTTGKQLKFEVLAATPDLNRLLLSFKKDLARLGIAITIRVVDSSQYQLRRKSYDFDMIQFVWRASLSPGNEQLFRWSSEAGKVDGSYNVAGVDDPAVDRMIKAMLEAKDSEAFVSAVHALDRVLLAGDYVIPLFHLPKQWMAYWSHLKAPERTALFGYELTSWWHGKAHAEAQTSGK